MKKFMKKALVLLSLSLLVGCSNQTKDTYTIAIVQPVDHPSLNNIRESIILGLEEAGLKDKITIIEKNANNDGSLLPSIMNNLKAENVDLIVPIATGTAQAALAATQTIPIVFSAVSNPVEAGLVSSFTDTSGNITGVSDAIATEEILKLALELTPNIKTFGFVYNSSEINSVTGIKSAKEFCDANRIAYKEATITGTGDLLSAATSLVDSVDAFYTPIDNTVASAMATYSSVAKKANLPIYVSADSMVSDGGLATIGIDYTELGKQTAKMIINIYNGTSIKDIPVEVMTEYSKMINKTVADELGISLTTEALDSFVIIQ